MTPPAASTPLFALEAVTHDRGGREVLRDVTLDIPGGQVVALIGPSGAGKSSLVRLLNRLDDPRRGVVRLEGTPVDTLPVRTLRRRVGFVFQAPTMFAGTVADNLQTAARHAAQPPLAAASLAELLAAVELSGDFLDHAAGELSGGEQQRVSIARALATQPDVLVLDEPTSALDPERAERFMATVARLNATRGLSVIMVTHRLAEARQWSATTVMLDDGRVVESGPTPQLFADPREARTRAFVRSAA